MNKLDGKFKGTLLKVKNNTIVPEDEWVVFLAKDNAFAATLPTYLEHCIKMECDDAQIEAVKKLIERVTDWRKHNVNKLKKPDAVGEFIAGQ